ncbi:MAG: pyridoxal phosphate-dependent aminotransferase [Acidobacteriia bacterium]|nr:pyridoxal phosphate-dependent aminotransferase [Terriglobia bacterium]
MESIKTQRIPNSAIRLMVEAAERMEREGREVVHLEIGRPDFNTPAHVVEACVEALRAGRHHYCPNAGIPELRRAIVRKFADEYRLEYDPASGVIVTNGVAEAVYLAMNALLNPGDQILIPDPGWLNYEVDAVCAYAEPIGYTLSAENGYQPDVEEIADKITPRTRMIMLVSPSNPVGSVTRPEVLEGIAALAQKHNLIVVSDEIYEKIIYPPARHHSIACLPGMKERTLLLNGFSKFWSMTGWRLGYVLGPQQMIDPMLRYHLYLLTSVATFTQYGALAALTGDQGPSNSMVAELKRRRDYLAPAVNQIPGFSCLMPEGAFYVFVDARATGLDGYRLADVLLQKAGVVTVAGECFGKNGAGHIRLALTSPLEKLHKAVANMDRVMRELMRPKA